MAWQERHKVRNHEIAQLLEFGHTIRFLSEEYNLSPNRIRQILSMWNRMKRIRLLKEEE